MRRTRLLKILKYLKISLLVPFALLLLVHFFIKDRNFELSMIFNVSPIPVLIGLGLLLSLILIHHKNWFRGTLAVTCLLIVHWFVSYYGFKKVPVSLENNHVLFWNIDNTKFLPREAMREKVKTYDPEVIVFLETRKLSMIEVKYLKEQFPQYNFMPLQGYFLIGTKNEIEFIEYTKLESITRFNLVKVKIDGQLKTILIADIGVRRHYNRWQDLDDVLEYSLANNADIIIGDFNTPYESMHFDGFKENYKSFHDVSEGFAATWPKGLPLLELDQFWVSPRIHPISLKKFYFKEFSNHDMLIGGFKLKN